MAGAARWKANYPKAIRVSKSYMQKKIDRCDFGEHEIYRQTRNWDSRVWHCPKARVERGKWRVIKNRKNVIGKRGNRFALWRMYAIKDKAKVSGFAIKSERRKKWECRIYCVYTPPYSIYYLICRRIKYSIQGVY